LKKWRKTVISQKLKGFRVNALYFTYVKFFRLIEPLPAP